MLLGVKSGVSSLIKNNRELIGKVHILENRIRLYKLWNKENVAHNTKVWRQKLENTKNAFAACESKYKRQISQLQQDLRNQKQTYEAALDKIFTDNQNSMLLNAKTKTHYNEIDISKALSLKFISERAYNLVRDVWRLPLPTSMTLRT